MKAAVITFLLACIAAAGALTNAPAQTANDAILAVPPSSWQYNPVAAGNVINSAGGSSTPRQLAQWPALANMGISQTAFTMNGCALRPVHAHMRATGLLYVIQAANLTVGFVTESGQAITNTLTSGASTIFPQGLLHFQQNQDCNPAYYIITYNNEDPGTQVTVPGLEALPASVVTASLGQPASSYQSLLGQEPKSAYIANSDPDCLARCQALGVNMSAPAPAVMPTVSNAGR